MSDMVQEAVADRLGDDGEAGRIRALGAAVIIGFAVGVLAYRILRNKL